MGILARLRAINIYDYISSACMFIQKSVCRLDTCITTPYTVLYIMAETVLPIPEVTQPTGNESGTRPKLYILDYGAGNVRS